MLIERDEADNDTLGISTIKSIQRAVQVQSGGWDGWKANELVCAPLPMLNPHCTSSPLNCLFQRVHIDVIFDPLQIQAFLQPST